MTHDRDHGGDVRLRRSLEEIAGELGLGLEEEPAPRRMVGVLVPAAHSTSDVDQTEPPDAAGEDDDAAIEQLITRWEQLEHHEVMEVAGDVTSDPYVAITPSGTQLVDRQALEEWVKSDHFRHHREKFAGARPSERQVSGFQVVYLGPAMASVTYRTEEEGTDGRVYVSSSAAIVRREQGGWRVAAFTKFAQVR